MVINIFELVSLLELPNQINANIAIQYAQKEIKQEYYGTVMI